MNICVFGSGYVGLVSGACLAEHGHRIVAVDINEERTSALKQGKVPIHEPGLDELIERDLARGTISFTTSARDAVAESELIFICVGTPSDSEGHADLSFVNKVIDEIAAIADEKKLIVVKSTVPIGTCQAAQKRLDELAPGRFEVVSNPEFLSQGEAVDNFNNPDRVVVGVQSEDARRLMEELYKGVDAPMVITDLATAEMIKYASNAFLATKISFINSIANVCERVGADVDEVARGMGFDPRIGDRFLKAGPGFGGSCLPKDCKALISLSQREGYDFHLLKSVLKANEEQQQKVVEKVRSALGDLEGKTIGVLGLTFKAATDDTRDSPSAVVIKALGDAGARIAVFDPVLSTNGFAYDGLVDDPYTLAQSADALIVLTEWHEFTHLDLARIKELMKTPVVVDARNVFKGDDLRALGFTYFGVGKRRG